MTTINISLDDSRLTKLQQRAKAMNLPSVSALVEQMIEQAIDAEEISSKGSALSAERERLLEDIISDNRELLQRLAQ